VLQNDQVEELLTLVSDLDRATLITQFSTYPGRFPIDFTPEFLQHAPLERLRHIFVALCIQNQRLPQFMQSQVGTAA
jgi:hypothetical protein